MPLSLHAAIVPTWLQVLRAGTGWLDKAAASDLSEAEVVGARLAEDMLPFAYQVNAMAVHSAGAIEAVRAGVFTPDFHAALPDTIEGLRATLANAVNVLEAADEAELEGFAGRPMRFEIGPKRLDFDAAEFLLTFSQPNFFFHATTAYGVLRAHGVPVGKLDYLGKLRLAAPPA